MNARSRPRPLPILAALLLIAVLAPGVAAHSGITVGPYVIEIGWREEPAYAGQPNAVEVTISRGDAEEPVTDLAAGALSVVVSTGGVDGPSLALEPAFDAVARTGPLGAYEAEVVPTAVGDHTLHVTGSIHGTLVDATVAAVVEVETTSERSGPDLVLVLGGAGILLVLGAMAFLLIRVRAAPAEPGDG